MDWCDEIGLWDRIAELPPGQAKLARLAYAAGLQDGAEVAFAGTDDDTVAVVLAGVVTEVSRRAARAAADRAGTRPEDLSGCGARTDSTSAEYLARLRSWSQ